jgi:hypothetical protein
VPNEGDPPGWLPDPDRPGGLRWWNGLGWSDARQAADGARRQVEDSARTVAAGSTTSAQQVGGASRVPTALGATNGVAIAAVVLGVLSLFLGFVYLLPIVAVVVSVRALLRSRRLAAGGADRTGLVPSLIGLALSVVSLLAWAPVAIAVVQAFVEAFVDG